MAKDRNCCGLRPQDPNRGQTYQKDYELLTKSDFWRNVGRLSYLPYLPAISWDQWDRWPPGTSGTSGTSWMSESFWGWDIFGWQQATWWPCWTRTRTALVDRKIQKMIENESCSEIFHASLIRKYSHINLQGACFDPTHCPYMQNWSELSQFLPLEGVND